MQKIVISVLIAVGVVLVSHLKAPQLAGLAPGESLKEKGVHSSFCRGEIARTLFRQYGALACASAELYGEERALKVYVTYGETTELHLAVERGGPVVIPIIDHFMENDGAMLETTMRAIEVMESVGDTARELGSSLARKWFGDSNSTGRQKASLEKFLGAFSKSLQHDFTPLERGWVAIMYAKEGGPDFTRGYAVPFEGEVKPLPLPKIVSMIEWMAVGTIEDIWRKSALGETILPSEYAWATVEVASGAFIASKGVKALKLGRTAKIVKIVKVGKKASRLARFASKVRHFAPKVLKSKALWIAGASGLTLAALTNPSAFTEMVGDLFGFLPDWMVAIIQSGIWFVIIYGILAIIKKVAETITFYLPKRKRNERLVGG